MKNRQGNVRNTQTVSTVSCPLVIHFKLTPFAPSTADPPPYIDGIRINSPHYLTKMRLTSAGTHTFTLVVSQYEKQNTINYTLRVRKTSV